MILTIPKLSKLSEVFDLIVNYSDNFKASPFELICFCLRDGSKLLECSADPLTIQNIFDRVHSKGNGTVVVGVGLFPGLSNILLRDLASRVKQVKRLRLSIFISPFSQAGSSTCRLMAEHFAYDTCVIVDGQRVKRKTLEPVRISAAKPYSGLRLFFPEVVMLEKSLRIPNIETFLVPMPKILVTLLSLLRPILTFEFLKPINIFFLTVLRNVFLKGKPSTIRFHMIAVDAKGLLTESFFETDGGLLGIASATLAIARIVLSESDNLGLITADEVATSWTDVRSSYEATSPKDRVILVE